tara:strand:+ start:179 stop:658 length:480 start_codon:yes stop_codon:yes gene_type:complete
MDRSTLPEINYDEVYLFDISSKVSFWDLPKEVVYELFRDGRTASRFLELKIPDLFRDFEYVDGSGYDWLKELVKKVEGKCYTKGGCNFAPSKMVGSSRKVKPDEVQKHIEENDLDYILMDIREFPVIRMRFVKGSELIKDHPNCKIGKSKKMSKKYFNV